MSVQGKFLSLKNQLFVCFGFIVLFCGLLFHFFSDTYPMFRTFKYLFVIADCIGGVIVFLSLFFAFFSHRENLKESRKPLVIESALTFTFNFSLQASIFHYLFNNSLAPVNLGLFFIFASGFFFFVALYNLTLILFKKYYVILFTVFGFVSIGTLISGVLLTFTGSIEQITTYGIEVLVVGLMSILVIIIVLISYPKWKPLLLEDENEEDEEDEGDEKNEEIDEVEC